MFRQLRWLLPLVVLAALGCNGPNGDKLGSLLGDGSNTLHRELSREELAALPALNAIDLEAPMTRADYDLFSDHAQAFLVNVAAEHCLQGDPEALNQLINTYKPNVGQIVEDLRSGAQTPEELCRYVAVTRQAVWQELDKTVLTGESGDHLRRFWTSNTDMWNAVGYPNGPADVGAEAVREIGITGAQAADIIEIMIKMTIETGRVVNPEGTVYSPGSNPFSGPEPDEKAFMRIGNQAWNDMMAVFTSEQRRNAFRWWNSFEPKMTGYFETHRREYAEFDQTQTSATATETAPVQ